MPETKKILVIEDDRFLSNIYKTKLEVEGYAVLEANNGEEAIEVLKENTPDLILLDIVMPKMDGFGFLQVRKTNNAFKKIKVIILSNLGQETDIQEGMALGADGYVIKSDSGIDEVLEKVKEAIES